MTYGLWLGEAHTQLQHAADALAGGPPPAGMADLLAALAARQKIYSGLARHIELLAGNPPAPRNLSSDAARKILAGHGPPLARLYAGLHAAAVREHAYPSAEPVSAGARALHRAADAVAVAADILAGHVQPGGRPRTPEGAAIRAGGGVTAALADVARLTHDTLAADAVLSGWVRRGGRSGGGTAGPVIDAARWVVSSRLPLVAREVAAAGDGHTPLLRLLDTAPPTGQPAPGVTSVDDAGAALRAAHTWLWQNPGQVNAVHLRAGTQLGLGLTMLTPDQNGQSAVGEWRRAAAAAADLRGSPPRAEAQHAAAALVDVLTCTRNLLHPRHVTAPAGQRRTAAHQMAGHLPLLAAALHHGVTHAVGRGELFLTQLELRRPERAAIFYATPVWRRATVDHDQVAELTRALSRLAPATPPDVLGTLPARTSTARLAFPPPPRLAAVVPTPPAGTPSTPTGQTHTRPARRQRR